MMQRSAGLPVVAISLLPASRMCGAAARIRRNAAVWCTASMAWGRMGGAERQRKERETEGTTSVHQAQLDDWSK